MSSNHHGDIRGFHHLGRTWYAEANLKGEEIVDEVTFGFYCPDGGTSGEMAVKWRWLDARLTPYLQAWDDSWDTLHHFSDVVAAMAAVDDSHVTPEQFCELLLGCGFIDLTATKIGDDSLAKVRAAAAGAVTCAAVNGAALEAGATFGL